MQSPTLARLLALAWPVVVSRLSQTVVSFTDALMVAHLGGAAVAATSTGATNTYAVLILPMGTSFIVSSFSSQLFGAGDWNGARRFGWYGLGLALATQVVCLAALPLVPGVLEAFPADAEVRELMAVYLLYRLPSGGAAIGIEALSNYYGGLGRTRPGMLFNALAMVLNVGANWVLITGQLGFPALGVAGAALASTFSTVVAFGAFLALFVSEGRGLPAPAFSRSEFTRLLRFGLPSGFNWFIEFMAYAFFLNVVVAGLGTASLAAMNTVMTLNQVAFMPAFGLASAGAVLVGQAIGANRKDDVPAAVRLTVGTSIAWMCAVGAVYLALPELFLRPFARGADAALLLAAGIPVLRLSAAWQVFDAVAMSVAEALRAAGDTLFPMWARALLGWVVFVPGSYATVVWMGGDRVVATWWLIAYLALLAVVLGWRFAGGAWRGMSLLESEAALLPALDLPELPTPVTSRPAAGEYET